MVPIPEATAQALAYEQARTLLWLFEGAWGISVLVLLCWTGFSARMRDFAARMSGMLWGRGAVAIYGAFLAVLLSAWALPISWLKVLLMREFGLGDVSVATWLGVKLTQMAICSALAAMCLWFPYMVLRRTGKRAWFVAWLALAAFMLIMKTVGTLLIDPMFEPIGPLRDAELEQKLQALARTAGIDDVRIVVSQETAKSKDIGADARGLGPAVRIRLSEALTLSSEDQVLVVVAHELGHYKLGHLWQDMGLALAILFASLLAAQKAGEHLSKRFVQRIGFASLSDVASAPLLLALLTVASAIGAPLENALARREEHEANVFALELTRNNGALAEFLVKAQYTNLMNPRPNWLLYALRYDHPTLAAQIDFANTYRPWETGGPMRYESLFTRTRDGAP